MMFTPEEKEEKLLLGRPNRLFMLVLLFIHPMFGLCMAQLWRSWGLPLLGIFLLVAGVSFKEGHFLGKEVRNRVMPAVDSISADLAPFKIANGRFTFPEKVQLPYSRSFGDWQLDVTGKAGKPVMPEKKTCLQGVVVGSDSVVYWTHIASEKPFAKVVLNHFQLKQLGEVLDAKQGDASEKGQVKASDMQSFASLICMVASWACVLGCYACNLGTLLMSFLMFTAAMILFRTECRRNVVETLVLIVNSLFPPVVLTLLWSLLLPVRWSFSSMFTVGLLVYLVFIFLESFGVFTKRDGDIGEE